MIKRDVCKLYRLNALFWGILTITVFLGGALHAKEAVVLDITKFGARPDSGKDAGPAVKAALAKARMLGKPVTIRFPKGQYDFFKTSATKIHHPVTSCHRQWDHVTPFYLNDLRDITIDGGGSLFMMHGRMTPLILYRCERVKLVDFAIDQEFPSVQEARIIAVGDGVVDLRIHPDTRYVLGDDGKPLWLDADGQRSAQPNYWRQFDPEIKTYRGYQHKSIFKLATSVEEIQPSLLRCHLQSDTRGYIKGASIQWRHSIRNQQGVIILESRDVALNRVNLHATNGLGILSQLSHNLSFKNVNVEPRKESGRTAARHSDCFHACGCTGHMLIDECRFDRAHDDAMNIFNYIMHIKKKESRRTLLLRFPCSPLSGFNVFFPGEQIGYRHREELLLKGRNTVVSSELVDVNTVRITLKNDLPEDVSDFHIENLTRIPARTVIRNSYFGGVTTRGILMNTSRETVIEGNTFYRIRMSAILAKTPDGPWWLQNYINGLTIRDNRFVECGDSIRIVVQTQVVVPGEFPHHNVEIVGNCFERKKKNIAEVNVQGVKGLYVKKNIFETNKSFPHLVTVIGCADVQLDGNKISTRKEKATVLYSKMKSDEIKVDSGIRWVLQSK
jgi:hypothetical protein